MQNTYIAPECVSHGSFVMHTLGTGPTSQSLESTIAGGHNVLETANNASNTSVND